MRFASDNTFGTPPEIIEALARANDGTAASYGADEITARVERRFADMFERKVELGIVLTGIAANALSISLLAPGFTSILCHEEAHFKNMECGATEFYTGGAKPVAVQAGNQGKMDLAHLEAALGRMQTGDSHHMQPAAMSVTQASEFGTVYGLNEISQLCDLAHERGLKTHMDGARFANAVASLDCSPAELTWKAGIDVLSFGATKNGTMCADAVVLFDDTLADELRYRRKRGGHVASKGRFMAAQLDAYLADDLWLKNARHANAMAGTLARNLEALGFRAVYSVDANHVFVVIPEVVDEALRSAGAEYHLWPGPGECRTDGGLLIRLVTSFETSRDDIDTFLATATKALEAA